MPAGTAGGHAISGRGDVVLLAGLAANRSPAAVEAEAIEASAVLRPDQAIKRRHGRVQ